MFLVTFRLFDMANTATKLSNLNTQCEYFRFLFCKIVFIRRSGGGLGYQVCSDKNTCNTFKCGAGQFGADIQSKFTARHIMAEGNVWFRMDLYFHYLCTIHSYTTYRMLCWIPWVALVYLIINQNTFQGFALLITFIEHFGLFVH